MCALGNWVSNTNGAFYPGLEIRETWGTRRWPSLARSGLALWHSRFRLNYYSTRSQTATRIPLQMAEISRRQHSRLSGGALLGPLEFEIMAAIWKRGPSTVTEIAYILPQKPAHNDTLNGLPSDCQGPITQGSQVRKSRHLCGYLYATGVVWDGVARGGTAVSVHSERSAGGPLVIPSGRSRR
jgi:hypothetical protein